MKKSTNYLDMPGWKQRLHGFVCYQIAAFTALYKPVHTDIAMMLTLMHQFRNVSFEVIDGNKVPDSQE